MISRELRAVVRGEERVAEAGEVARGRDLPNLGLGSNVITM